MSSELEQVADVVRRATGISLGRSQLSSLAAALRRVDPALDPQAFLDLDTRRGGGAELLDRLIDEVTVNETFFFRQRRELDAIDWHGLRDTARADGRDTVRVWVAACASGEEAYTLAMLASEAFAPAPPPISIVATDISSQVLARARRGRYGRRALKALAPELRARYFDAAVDGIEVGERLRQLVEFRRHNLVQDPLPDGDGALFDLIACRNVLIYFDPDTVGHVIGLLESGLAPGGTLLLGAADRLCGHAHRLDGASPRPESPPRPRPQAAERTLRRPLGRAEAPAQPADMLAAALRAADAGMLEDVLELTKGVLVQDPLDARAHFVRGLAELGLGYADAAVISLRSALYVDPTFGLAAFKLGRAHEERGDSVAAVRAYEQALRSLASNGERDDTILDQVDVGDVAAACAMRLRALGAAA
jgi:chemotaxis protein methyltransferase CheR